ncbi:hypothetical protein KKB43_03535 [Patescibacteria group bacterium]|nr:hypothetical protein [Patescibacteria group bacterium]MBU4142222.1 hypothetical protein [Patescibacteria group bacterium]MBU4338300.1 hypothetical protein [Patescibacteria group bacterium]MBU4580063.1 hypothetical protein [Patescibacteria group bacterium]
MQDFLLLFIAVLLLILAVELSMIFYYAIIFLQDAVIIIKRVKALEGSLEEKLTMLENSLTLASGKIIKKIIKGISKFLKK